MEPLRVALLTSRHCEGLTGLLADPNRGVTWELAMVVVPDTSLSAGALLDELSIPFELLPIRATTARRNLRERESFDAATAELLARNHVDVVLLAGYPYIVTSPLLDAFPKRVLVLHDADLSRRDTLYAGRHAVRDALLAGEFATRSSVYLATADVARGPLFLLSGAYPFAGMTFDARERGDADFLNTYAALHRTWMIESCWGAMLRRTLELLAGGIPEVIGDVVWIDGAPGPCRMGESPAICHDPETAVTRGIPRSCPFIG